MLEKMLRARTGFFCALISMNAGEDAQGKEQDSSVPLFPWMLEKMLSERTGICLCPMNAGEDAQGKEQDSSVPLFPWMLEKMLRERT
jgi:hypothetical protein